MTSTSDDHNGSIEEIRCSSRAVAIILVNWNGWRDSIACIESCLALNHQEYRIVLCDNASSDGSVERILSWGLGESNFDRDVTSPVRITVPRRPRGVALLARHEAERGCDGNGAELLIVETGDNLGFAGGNNVGLRWALARGYQYAWLLNNDAVVRPDSLAFLIETMTANNRIGLCGSVMLDYHQSQQLQGFAGAIDRVTFRGRHLGSHLRIADLEGAPGLMSLDPAKRRETIYPIGASIFVSRNFLEEVGLMEESYFLYHEEADWAFRSEGLYQVAVADRSYVYHKLGASIESAESGLQASSAAYLYRSRLRLARSFAPFRLPLVILAILAEALWDLARGRSGRLVAAGRALTGRVRVPRTEAAELTR